ncbi:DivIVA domain protein [Desulfitobacterium dichloroeliminans LMG P-21439]|uniref:DivIVA domain protein n=1 Tax=Desulfitobacterium dichloroeliminans (strain LMG P-21439 / DCA1) TaxID=871963 RepID=L0F8P5_DESDL|nr:DivIVA domain-containing protein [Desulfitobacterium dichloroeliminans]AGA70199.1 DivIVA domain protein [Desulfitobacterium dichloroeliminans LMG P-21439]
MALTPIDIQNKEFRKGVRGYHTEEVDKFLESVSKEFEVVYAENFELKDKVQRLDAELRHYKQLESTLQQTMVLAQQTADEVKQSARHEAELILKEVEQEKVRRITEAQNKLQHVNDEIEELQKRREMTRTQLKSFLLAQLDLAEAFEKDRVS